MTTSAAPDATGAPTTNRPAATPTDPAPTGPAPRVPLRTGLRRVAVIAKQRHDNGHTLTGPQLLEQIEATCRSAGVSALGIAELGDLARTVRRGQR